MQRWPHPLIRRLFSFILTLTLWAITPGAITPGAITPGAITPGAITPLAASAETLSDRLAHYPNWQHKPTTQAAQGDLTYPEWFTGDWQLESTLVSLEAPLAPAITTPGFEGNRAELNHPIAFPVRFVSANLPQSQSFKSQSFIPRRNTVGIVADRAYNGMSIAKAYLGADRVQSVQVDPTNPNRQLTILKGNRQLESTITDRAIEQPESDRFITTELFQQVFRGTDQPYLNQVETTTDYHHQTDPARPITADQITAIYLAPNDPYYFQAGDSPVALYRYKLVFSVTKVNRPADIVNKPPQSPKDSS
jgi:hypothetical protein